MGFLLVLAIMLPVAGVLLLIAAGARHAERIAAVLMPAGFCIAVAIVAVVWDGGTTLSYQATGFTHCGSVQVW